jgi:hypothetical protein
VGVIARAGTLAAGYAKGEQPDTSRTRHEQTRKQKEAVEPMPRIWFLPKGHRPTKSLILFARSLDVNPTTILNTLFSRRSSVVAHAGHWEFMPVIPLLLLALKASRLTKSAFVIPHHKKLLQYKRAKEKESR